MAFLKKLFWVAASDLLPTACIATDKTKVYAIWRVWEASNGPWRPFSALKDRPADRLLRQTDFVTKGEATWCV